MSIILYGVTSGGTSVPIEVTDEGKLVVDTSNFPTDEFIKQGDDIEAGSITAAGTVKVGPDTASIGDNTGASIIENGAFHCMNTTKNGTAIITGYGQGTQTFKVSSDGSATFGNTVTLGTNSSLLNNAGWGFQVNANANENGYALYLASTHSLSTAPYFLRCYVDGVDTVDVKTDGSASLASGQAGFTADGELYFYSRGTRYKAVVQGGNVAAEPFTRATELRAKAAKLREPRTQDIVPED